MTAVKYRIGRTAEAAAAFKTQLAGLSSNTDETVAAFAADPETAALLENVRAATAAYDKAFDAVVKLDQSRQAIVAQMGDKAKEARGLLADLTTYAASTNDLSSMQQTAEIGTNVLTMLGAVDRYMSPRNRWPFSRDGIREVAEVSGGLQIDNGEALRAATLAGAGISYLPLDLVRDDIAAGELIRLLSEWETLTLPINLLYPTRRTPRRVSALMQLFTSELRQSHPI